jgi:hypothetical protein
MKKLLKIFAVSVSLLTSVVSFSQAPTWENSPESPDLNFFSIVDTTEHYFDSTGLDSIPGTDYKKYKRWEYTFRNISGSPTKPGDFSEANKEMFAIFNDPSLICNGSATYPNSWNFIGHSKTDGS